MKMLEMEEIFKEIFKEVFKEHKCWKLYVHW